MSLYRVSSANGDGPHEEAAPYVPLEAWLADLQNERDCIISRLRHIDKVLIENGRLKEETIPRRVR